MQRKAFIIKLEKGDKHQLLLQGKPQTNGMRAGKIFLLPGQDCKKHSTNNNEELLVFLAGKGEVIIEKGDCLQVGVKKVCYIPPETVHSVRNTGEEPLIYIYCVSAAGWQY